MATKAPRLKRRTGGKPLRDMRGHVYRLPEPPGEDGRVPEPPDAETCRRLAAKHGFPDGFDLERHLQWAHEDWRRNEMASAAGTPTGREHREFLEKMAAHAMALHEALKKAGSVQRSAVLDCNPRLDFGALEWDVRSLAAAATVGARHVPDSTAGKKENAALLNLLARLRNIYCEVHGESAPKVTTDPDTGRHSGPFYEFTRDALQALGVPNPKGSTALGQNILKAIRLRDAAKRHEGKLKIE